MGFLEELENFKKDLRDEWIKYYAANRTILAKLEIDKGGEWWNSDSSEEWTLPRSETILAVLLALRPDLRDELDFFAENTQGKGRHDQIIYKLDLAFNIKKKLDQETSEDELEIQANSEENLSPLDDIREQIKLQNGEIT